MSSSRQCGHHPIKPSQLWNSSLTSGIIKNLILFSNVMYLRVLFFVIFGSSLIFQVDPAAMERPSSDEISGGGIAAALAKALAARGQAIQGGQFKVQRPTINLTYYVETRCCNAQ